MKEIISENYGLEIIGLIKITEKLYKVKTKQGFFALKIINNQDFPRQYQYIRSLHLEYFISIVLNHQSNILTPYENYYFYIMPWINIDEHVVKELKLKYYFQTIAIIHNHSFYTTKVHDGYFKNICENLREMIVSRQTFYLEKIQSIELNYFKSPSEWEFILNYNRIIEHLKYASKFLEDFEQLTINKNTVRLSLVYMNFDVNHISLEQQKIISIDKMKIDLPIYDIYDLYLHQNSLKFENDLLIEHYLSKFILYDYEKLLLACLLSCLPMIEFSTDQINNLIVITRLCNYLESTHQLIKKLNLTAIS
jgi:hypothetical protein